MIAWPVNTLPTDSGVWLECNGQSCSAYPKLVDVLSSSTVPNYQGMFLRGYGSQTFSQNNGSTIGVTSTTHSASNLGIIQGDAIREITGSFEGNNDDGGGHKYGAFFDTRIQVYGANGNGSNWGGEIHFVASRVTPTSNEIRPINIAIKYLIKAQ
ncbi:MAG: hypothetical protein H6Q70_102 [Firmicutes bacterium]|nr:hypothetical protein [Bacillota bacterium]